MAIPKKIGDALSRIQNTIEQKNNIHIIHSSEVNRVDRELLIRTKWLERIIRGWYIVVRPDIPSGESSAWYASFWDFLNLYLKHHYGKNYCDCRTFHRFTS